MFGLNMIEGRSSSDTTSFYKQKKRKQEDVFINSSVPEWPPRIRKIYISSCSLHKPFSGALPASQMTQSIRGQF